MQTTETSHDVLEAASLLVTAGVLSHSWHAGLSGRSGGNRFVVTATGVIRELTSDQLAIASLDGGVVEGEPQRHAYRAQPRAAGNKPGADSDCHCGANQHTVPLSTRPSATAPAHEQ
jgi:hypothetical protein